MAALFYWVTRLIVKTNKMRETEVTVGFSLGHRSGLLSPLTSALHADIDTPPDSVDHRSLSPATVFLRY